MNITQMLAQGHQDATTLIQDPDQGLRDNHVNLWHHAKWMVIMNLGDSIYIGMNSGTSVWLLSNGTRAYTDGKVIW